MNVCERQGCGKSYEPYGRGKPQRFCSKQCRELDWNLHNPGKRGVYTKTWNDANKEYLSWAAVKRNYGLTREQWDAMLVEQSGRCGICIKPLEGKVDVDHDHVTGKVRSLLCHRCNIGLSYVEDADFKAKAEAYLEKHRV